MTKINFLPFSKLFILGVIAILLFSGILKAQDSSLLQKAFQSCLDHSEVQPHLKGVSFDDNREVLAVLKNKYVTSEIKLRQFGKEAVISPGTDLFFYGIEDYVRLSDVSTKKDNITLTFSAEAKYTCTFSGNKGKVIKLKRLPAE